MDTLLKPAPGDRKYSITWARSVVDKLWESYPRATEAVLEYYDISLENLAAALAKGDPVFDYMKKRIKYIARQEENQRASAKVVQMLSDELHYVMLNSTGKTQERLDSRIKTIQTQRAGFKRAEPGRSEAESGRHPSTFFQLLLFPNEQGETREIYEVRFLQESPGRDKQGRKSRKSG